MQAAYLNGLNEKQLEAVLHIKGPLMIIAGAGSGKTKVLTTRVAHLMHSGVDSFKKFLYVKYFLNSILFCFLIAKFSKKTKFIFQKY
jgi:superfamily I DNA and RNA helicase